MNKRNRDRLLNLARAVGVGIQAAGLRQAEHAEARAAEGGCAMSKASSDLPEHEVARLIHLRNELVILVEEWKKHGWGKGMASRFAALDKVLRDEPAPSEAFTNLATKRKQMTEEECRAIANGALLALVARSGGLMHINVQEIFEAHAHLGTLALSLSNDDRTLTLTGVNRVQTGTAQ